MRVVYYNALEATHIVFSEYGVNQIHNQSRFSFGSNSQISYEEKITFSNQWLPILFEVGIRTKIENAS